MPNSNIQSDIQNEVNAVIKHFHEGMNRITALELKWTALGGADSIFTDKSEIVRTGVTGAEVESAVASLITLRDAYTKTGHKTNLFKITG